MSEQKLYTSTVLALYLGIELRTLQRLIANGAFPVQPVIEEPVKRWSKQQVDDWLAGKRV